MSSSVQAAVLETERQPEKLVGKLLKRKDDLRFLIGVSKFVDDMFLIMWSTMFAPTRSNPLGIKGVGENGTCAATPSNRQCRRERSISRENQIDAASA